MTCAEGSCKRSHSSKRKAFFLCRHTLEPIVTLHAMNATDLSRRLKQLRRAVIMLQTEVRSEHLVW